MTPNKAYSEAHQEIDKNLPGIYYGSEAGTWLELKENKRFTYFTTNGVINLQANGKWSIKPDKNRYLIDLITDPDQPPRLSRLDDQTTASPQCLEPFDLHPERIILVVCLLIPGTDAWSYWWPEWNGLKVIATFANGKTRTGFTGDHGKLAFGARPEPEWLGTPIKKVTLSHPKMQNEEISFEVPVGTKTLAIRFDPGSLVAPAFKEMEMRAELQNNEKVRLEIAKPPTGLHEEIRSNDMLPEVYEKYIH